MVDFSGTTPVKFLVVGFENFCRILGDVWPSRSTRDQVPFDGWI